MAINLNTFILNILEWVELLSSDLISTLVLLLFIGLILLELIIAVDRQDRIKLTRSYLTNIGLFVFNNLLFSMLSITTLLLLVDRYHHKGMLTSYNQTVQALLAFVLLDLVLYLWHKACHNYDHLWQFHRVHHCDPTMNVTTAFRVHFIEIVLTLLIKAVFIMVTGVEAAIVAICDAVSTCFVMFHHINISFKAEKWLKWLFIVPAVHKVHHSKLRYEHDNNYGAVFSIWDRLFKTFVEARPVETGLANVAHLSLFQLIKYGLFPDRWLSIAKSTGDIELHMIEEAAYYKAEKRGFAPGFEILDWLEAEKQISGSN